MSCLVQSSYKALAGKTEGGADVQSFESNESYPFVLADYDST
jgi:hypothetical protein